MLSEVKQCDCGVWFTPREDNSPLCVICVRKEAILKDRIGAAQSSAHVTSSTVVA
jgi:hypothetical protein